MSEQCYNVYYNHYYITTLLLLRGSDGPLHLSLRILHLPKEILQLFAVAPVTHTHTHPHPHTHTHARTHARTCTHVRTRTHARTHHSRTYIADRAEVPEDGAPQVGSVVERAPPQDQPYRFIHLFIARMNECNRIESNRTPATQRRDGWMEGDGGGWMDGWMEGWNGWMGWMEWMDGWMEWMDGRMDGWTDGWMD